MTKLPSFIKIPSHRKFNYDPRYYDPVKEELEERIRRIKAEQNSEPAAYQANLTGEFKKIRENASYNRKKNQSNLRLVLIIAALLFMVYLLF